MSNSYKIGDKVKFASEANYSFWKRDGIDFSKCYGIVTGTDRTHCVDVDIFHEDGSPYYPHEDNQPRHPWTFLLEEIYPAYNMAKEIIIWALPPGKSDPIHEVPISSRCRTPEDVEKVKTAAAADGWHGFRVVEFDPDEDPSVQFGRRAVAKNLSNEQVAKASAILSKKPTKEDDHGKDQLQARRQG